MTEKDTTILKQYTNPLSRSIQEQYAISPDHYRGDIKLGLRNNDGTGVLVGVSKVGSVQGYLMQDGQRVPAPGKLYYRGIELTDIVEAHRKAGTFGFEEVAYLLLMGYLPSKSELAYFDKIMNQARKLPEGFTEGMIMRHPSHNIMNELARSVLSLYSYDRIRTTPPSTICCCSPSSSLAISRPLWPMPTRCSATTSTATPCISISRCRSCPRRRTSSA